MKFLRFLFIFAVSLLLVLVIQKHPSIETNLTSAFFAQKQGTLLQSLSQKSASEINVIFEGEDIEDIQTNKKAFLKNLDNVTKNIKPIYYRKMITIY